MADDLDAVVRRADPDRWLASRFIADRDRRAYIVALYAFDHELTRVRRLASNALLAEIRLTWWREVLDELFAGGPVRFHPVARALADVVARYNLPREPLEAMIEARIAVLDKAALNADEALQWADGVGGSMAVLAALILDAAAPPETAAPAGRVWGLILLRRAGLVGGDIDRLIKESLTVASRAARALSAAAFPAVACATLARARPSSGPRPALETRLRLIWAVARGIL
ncbi:MAG: squalene/phytoene synthase family protein [Caulobacteraceae bacterium]